MNAQHVQKALEDSVVHHARRGREAGSAEEAAVEAVYGDKEFLEARTISIDRSAF